MRKGLFITIEGIEGAGKSTQVARIEKQLKDLGETVVVTREPGGTAAGEQIRNILLHGNDLHLYGITELCLMCAARAQHINQVIKPALDKGYTVLCDRFTDSTYAYQGYGREIELSKIQSLENVVQDDLRPDMTILLDLEVETGLQRTRKRGKVDRFESETVEFFNRVRKGYLEQARQHSDRFFVVDASKSIKSVEHSIKEIIKHKIT